MADLKISQLSAVSEVQGTDVFPTVSGLATMKASAAQIKTYVTESLDVNDSAVAGSYVTAVSEADGVISVTREVADVKPTANSTKMLTSGGAKAALDEKQNTLTFDNTPTANSNNPVRSGGVYTEVNSLKETLTNKVTNVSEVTSKASAASISITDAMGVNAKHVVAKIEPVQAGSGTPSPSNVRAISGWNNIAVATTKKNIFGGVWTPNMAIDTINGNITNYSGRSVDENFYPVKPNTTYYGYVSFDTGLYAMLLYQYDSNKNIVSSNNIPINRATFTTSPTTAYIRVVITTATNLDTITSAINYPATETAYEPYKGKTVEILLGDTIYGGELDATTGVLTVDRGYTLLTGTENHSDMVTTASYKYFDIYKGLTNFLAYDDDVLSNLYPNNVQAGGVGRRTQLNNVGSIRLIFSLDESITADAAMAEIQTTNMQYVYHLGTPISIQLTPQDIQLLEGLNNVYANSGNIAVDYYTQTVGNLAASVSQTQALDNEQEQDIYGLTANEYANGCVNLLPNTATSQVLNGVTFTVNKNKTIKGNGTGATAQSYLTVYSGLQLPVGRYKVSGFPKGSYGNSSVYLYKQGIGNDVSDTGDGAILTVTDANAKYDVIINTKVGTVYNNVEFRPMITLADVPNSDYNHYVPYAKSNKQLTDETAVKALSPTLNSSYFDNTASVSCYQMGKLVMINIAGVTIAQIPNGNIDLTTDANLPAPMDGNYIRGFMWDAVNKTILGQVRIESKKVNFPFNAVVPSGTGIRINFSYFAQ